jgi:methylated-DNA-protein-cysteine methyltransferase-like protein
MFGMDIPPSARDQFFQTVWNISRLIPAGKVSTYGQIAGYIPMPPGILPEDYKANKARWVGFAMAACPPDVPWQRVINAQGKISTRKGAETQRRLLESEGIEFDSHDKVDLARCSWTGPTADWLRQNGLSAPDEPQQLSLI